MTEEVFYAVLFPEVLVPVLPSPVVEPRFDPRAGEIERLLTDALSPGLLSAGRTQTRTSGRSQLNTNERMRVEVQLLVGPERMGIITIDATV